MLHDSALSFFLILFLPDFESKANAMDCTFFGYRFSLSLFCPLLLDCTMVSFA